MILVSALPERDWGDFGKVTRFRHRARAHEIGEHTQGPLVWGKPTRQRDGRMLEYLARLDLASLKDSYRHKRLKTVPNQYFKSGEKWLEAGYNSTSW